MTAIIAIKDKDGSMYMGCDGLVSCDFKRPSALSKTCVKKIGNEKMLIGCTGSIKDLQLIQHVFIPAPRSKKMNPDKYMLSVFTVDLLEFLMENNRAWSTKNDQYESYLMVCYAGKIYFIDSAMAVVRSSAAFDACGSGAQVALGVLEATKAMDARKRIELGLRSAEKYIESVGRPFTIKRI